ncbi:CGLAU_01105 family protein [Corynebacterium accolens]|uniref:CGLAU_01105 family protein n=1 Tax=Corynebacterium accolens TaxID=38284 RepID=UPI00242E0A71|nr:CGLAU_01105 family protein [Corynebacterium accolens]MDK4295371.1 CGLAU_01105 family protein [Corynebacterium accolens]MDK8682313.1 CGLAU_01105 family protein [Corynebacterium accolens]WKS62476.1 CGLAU_01105 family protein [Corynebacterium accolens]
MTEKKKLFDSLKEAGASALNTAKDFGGRLQEERENQGVQGAGAQGPQGENDGMLDKATTTAKQWGASIKKAAEETRDSEAFSEAKDKFADAYQETREGVKDAYDYAQERVNEKKNAPKNGNSAAADKDDNIIDGEVIDTDEPTN